MKITTLEGVNAKLMQYRSDNNEANDYAFAIMFCEDIIHQYDPSFSESEGECIASAIEIVEENYNAMIGFMVAEFKR